MKVYLVYLLHRTIFTNDWYVECVCKTRDLARAKAKEFKAQGRHVQVKVEDVIETL